MVEVKPIPDGYPQVIPYLSIEGGSAGARVPGHGRQTPKSLTTQAGRADTGHHPRHRLSSCYGNRWKNSSAWVWLLCSIRTCPRAF